MDNNWYINELRKKIEDLWRDQGRNYNPIDKLTEYVGNRLTSDSAQFYAMKAKEEGGSTLQIIEAAFYGAFGVRPKRSSCENLSAEKQTEMPS